MKIGHCDSINGITPAHWQKMAKETQLGWPMIRERMSDLARKTLDAVRILGIPSRAQDQNMVRTVTETITKRASRML
jgi:hypothetical protein